MRIEQLSEEEKDKWTNADPWIRTELSNNEVSSNEELTNLFMKQGPMNQEEAAYWIDKRNFFLNNIVMDDGSVYKPPDNESRKRIK